MATAERIVQRLKVCLILVCMTFMTACINDDVAESESLVGVGDTIPHFSVTMNDGRTVTAESLRGRPSVIVFFTTQCHDCRRLLPVIQNLHERMPGLAIVCISREESARQIESYWRDNSLTLDYSAQSDRKVYNLFAKEGVPRTYVVNSSLTVTATFDDTSVPTVGQLIELCDPADI